MLFGVGLLRSLEPVGTVASPFSLSVLGLGYFPTNSYKDPVHCAM